MSDDGVNSSPSSSSDPSLNINMRLSNNLPDNQNARSKTITIAEGPDTYGALNCHPSSVPANPISPSEPNVFFRIGVSEDRNKRCRKTMEDAHSFVYDFAGIRGQGYFAVFDGHAGKHAAEWCGQNFHEYFLDALISQPAMPVPDLLNKTFHVVDLRLTHLAHAARTSSGCTAVTAFLRAEHVDAEKEPKGFLNPSFSPRGLMEGMGEDKLEAQTAYTPSRRNSLAGGTNGSIGGASSVTDSSLGRKTSGRRIRDFVRGLTGADKKDEEDDIPITPSAADGSRIEAIEPQSEKGLKWVLYTANVGDARAVLCRDGKAVRLTYDHKGSDTQEAKRIMDAGGFVMNNRVNGVLAVTRSLGDASMKEFVVGSPYTTETVLDEMDEFLIVACDGLWDVCQDQEAVNLIRNVHDPQAASKILLDHAITNYSTDNLSVMVIRFYRQ
ncbi:hypothetical protein TREMEDRAFT_37088 [Tremella mesenterica DSM 1558]|uniref:uncharacterized protein n=1 Tax=Tremella mesenterica (strain ATCC 24925 / CBS 8224 / DSM 1558 / NBRC 9311 / NRRL Y-6157 / RJB 2259-6 / UBC 559-6) TaxID=578456 RepID=UPI0003F4A293|nr:uncharacterized protein TREMEDRAFT_37088 [Tremella mesenterica DSM 1558]EIW72968.1 hypothetical protein TREMEDRAFT_37088 [Tremella mesenterica DSM 1558]